MKIRLYDIAHARSGDKGDTANVGVIARDRRDYPLLVERLSAERVRAHFAELVHGKVERHELPNLGALNFLLHEALDGGGTVSLMTDAQGKTFSTALLRMVLDVPDDVGERVLEARRRALAGHEPTANGARGEPGPGGLGKGTP